MKNKRKLAVVGYNLKRNAFHTGIGPDVPHILLGARVQGLPLIGKTTIWGPYKVDCSGLRTLLKEISTIRLTLFLNRICFTQFLNFHHMFVFIKQKLLSWVELFRASRKPHLYWTKYSICGISTVSWRDPNLLLHHRWEVQLPFLCHRWVDPLSKVLLVLPEKRKTNLLNAMSIVENV